MHAAVEQHDLAPFTVSFGVVEAGTATTAPPEAAIAPFSLRVTTSIGTSTAAAVTAASKSSVSISANSSASLAKTRSIVRLRISSRNSPR